MSDWKTLDLLTPEDQERARALFKPDDPAQIADYEFTAFGPKMMRRVVASKQKSTIASAAPAATPKRKDKETGRGGDKETVKPSAAVLDDGSERVLQMPIASVLPCPLNPRKKYGEQGIKELADTIRSVGRIIHPLVVRPCLAGLTRPDMYEVIAGHRRLKAAPLAGLEMVPVIVRPMSDRTALDVMLSENLQREDLTPIEEAAALKSWLELTEEDGSPRTVAMASLKHGKSEMHIGTMLRLLRLPKKAREALEGGEIGREVGVLIARMPTDELRKRFTDDVLKGHGEGAMSKREAKEHSRRSYMVELRGSPFDQRVATLVPVTEKDGERIAGGACTDCPWNTANMPDAEDRTHLCTNPGCYQAKVNAHVGLVKEKALAAGMLVIEGEKARRYVYHDGTPTYDSGMVKLDQTPSQAEVVGDKKPPTWKKMLAGKATGEVVTGRTEEGEAIKGKVKAQINVPAVLVIDERGRAHELVERKTAIEAAKKNGFGDIFTAKAGRAKSGEQAEQLERAAAEKEAAKLEARATSLGMEDLTAVISARQFSPDIWPGMVELALFHAGFDGQAVLCKRRNIECGKEYGDREKALRQYAKELTPERVPAFAVELLLGGWMKQAGVATPAFRVFAESYGLSLPSYKARAKAESEAGRPKKKAWKKEEEPTPVRDLIAELAKKRGLSLAEINDLAAEAIGKTYEEAKGSELTTIVEAIKAVPIVKKEKGGWEYDHVENVDACPECGATYKHTDDGRHLRECTCGFNGWTPEITREGGKKKGGVK